MPRPQIGITVSTLWKPAPGEPLRYSLPVAYAECVRREGGLPFLIPHAHPSLPRGEIEEALALMDGLLLSGGGDVDPRHYGEEPIENLGEVDHTRDDYELELARAAWRRDLPLLAICRGVQVLNVVAGGTLVQDIPSEVEGSLPHSQTSQEMDRPCHAVSIEGGSLLARLLEVETARVNSHHHQAADRIGDGLCVSARSDDGVIEALEDPRRPFCLGVQWHPERLPADPHTRRIFRGFVEAARARVATTAST